MARQIIIPAAGRATRFGGCPKELLPISEGDCSLTRAVAKGKELGDVVVITSREKEELHRAVIRQRCLTAFCEFIRQGPNHKEMWGAVQLGMMRDKPCGIILADTVTTIAEPPATGAGISFGIFETQEPHRFSVVQNALEPGKIISIRTKENLCAPQFAWGMVFWRAEVTNFFQDNSFEHHDRAFEAAANRFGFATFQLGYYFDLGTFPAYLEFLNYGKNH